MSDSYKPGALASIFGTKPVIHTPKPVVKKDPAASVGSKRGALSDFASSEPSKKRQKLSNQTQKNNKNNNNDVSQNSDEMVGVGKIRLRHKSGGGRPRALTRDERKMEHKAKMRQKRFEKRLEKQKGHKLSQIDKLKLTPDDLRQRQETSLRTLFIGNIPIYWKKKNIINLLSKWKQSIEEIYFSNYIKSKDAQIQKQIEQKLKKRNKDGKEGDEAKKEKNDKKDEMNEEDEESDENDEMEGKDTKANKNAWIRMKRKECVAEAVILNNTVIDGKYTLRVDFADASLNRNNEKSVFIGGLPLHVNEEQIRKYFDAYCTVPINDKKQNNNNNRSNSSDGNVSNVSHASNIVNVRILRDPKTQMSKGCGFIEFDNLESVSKALDLHLTKFKLDNNNKNKRRHGPKEKPQRIRVMPCVANPQQLNPNNNKNREHLKQVLGKHATKLRGKKGQIIANFDGKEMGKSVNKEYFHKGRDPFMVKMRWRDHPELREKSFKKRAKKMKITLSELKQRMEIKKQHPDLKIRIRHNDESDDSDVERILSRNKFEMDKNEDNTNGNNSKDESREYNNNNNNNKDMVGKNGKNGKRGRKGNMKRKEDKWGTNLYEKKQNILKQQKVKRGKLKHKAYLRRQRIKRKIAEMHPSFDNTKNNHKSSALQAMGEDFDVAQLGDAYGFGNDDSGSD